MENQWAIVNKCFKSDGLVRKQDKVSFLLKIWPRDPDVSLICRSLVNSMPKMIKALIDAKSGHNTH